MTPDQLEAIVLGSTDVWQIQRACEHLDEKARAKLSTAAQKIHAQLHKNKANDSASESLKAFIAGRKGESWSFWNAAETRIASLALFALCPLSVVKKRDLFFFNVEGEVFHRIIEDRRPDWLTEWVAHTLDEDVPRLEFHTLRKWIRDGLCAKPEVDGYYRAFAAHMMRTGFYARGESVPPLSRQLLDDPDLLQDVDGLFRVETMAFNTNGWLTKGAAEDHETWPDALVRLCAEGHLDREHLLTLALDGLTLDLKQNQLSGFHGFYKRMAPSVEELSRHQQRFVGLLCHSVGHVVKFAIDMLGEVEKQGRLDDVPMLRETQTVFASEGKGNAVAALKLIGRIINRRKGEEGEALGAVCEALRHGHADVQSLALDLLEKHAARLDETQWNVVRDLEGFVAASNRRKLASLLERAPASLHGMGDVAVANDVFASAMPSQDPADVESYSVISDDINAQQILFAEDELVPIASVDELIDAILHAIEVVDSPDEIERIIDGVSRLAGDRPFDFEARVSPLVHRLNQGGTGSNGLRSGGAVGVALFDLIASWLTRKHHRTPIRTEYYTPEEAFAPISAHLRSIAQRVAQGQSQSLLSAATHKGGWIDPRVWIERLKQAPQTDETLDSVDLSLSLLRLAPDHRDDALAQATGLSPSLDGIARLALAGDALPTKADQKHYAPWIAAARCHAPAKDWSAEFAPLNLDDDLPGGLRPARYDWLSSATTQEYHHIRWKTAEFEVTVGCDGVSAAPERSSGLLGKFANVVSGRLATNWKILPTAAISRQGEKRPHYWSGDLNTTWVAQWLAHVWPQNPAASHFKGATKLIGRVDENSSNWEPGHGYFHALFQRNRPWGEAGHLLLCFGLVGKDADAKGLAVDALIEAIDGRRFDPLQFAAVMTRLGQADWVKLNRLGDALMPVIQVSALHASVVGEALQGWLPALDLQQKNAFRLLEVLIEAQALARQPLRAEAQDALRRVAGSGKAAKLAKQLLAA